MISVKFFVQFVGDGCLVDKARDGPDLVSAGFPTDLFTSRLSYLV